MSKRVKIWDYLDETGVLEYGTEEEIKQAKKEYRKKYLLEYKRNYRQRKQEFIISFDRDNGELSRVIKASKAHRKSVPEFVKSAVFGYLERKYVVPNTYQVAQLELLLSQVLNEIQQIAGKKERFFWEKNSILESIEARIQKLEGELNQIFRHPPETK